MACIDEIGSVLMADGSELSYDGLPSIDFKCVFTKLPHTIFFLQTWNVPGVTLGKIVRPTSYLDIDEVGEKIQYEQFSIEFMIDKRMKNFREIYDWMKTLTVNPNQRDEVTDASIIMGDSSIIKFVDVWPSSLSGMRFMANATNMDYLKCTAVFNYDYYELSEVAR